MWNLSKYWKSLNSLNKKMNSWSNNLTNPPKKITNCNLYWNNQIKRSKDWKTKIINIENRSVLFSLLSKLTTFQNMLNFIIFWSKRMKRIFLSLKNTKISWNNQITILNKSMKGSKLIIWLSMSSMKKYKGWDKCANKVRMRTFLQKWSLLTILQIFSEVLMQETKKT